MKPEKAAYIKNWLFRANEDIDVMESLIHSGVEHYTSTICFHAQQAVEKFLKSFLIFHDQDFPKTHDVDFLLMKCQELDPDIFEGIDLQSLTDFGVTVRYPDDFYIPSVAEAKMYNNIAQEIKKIVEKQMKG